MVFVYRECKQQEIIIDGMIKVIQSRDGDGGTQSEKYQFLCDRLKNQTFWYIRHAAKNKRWHHILSVSVAALPIIVVLVNIFWGNMIWRDYNVTRILVTAVNLVVTGCALTLGLKRYQERWTDYRYALERILSECTMFAANAGPYQNATKEDDGEVAYKEDDSLALFVSNVEAIISNEVSRWQSSNKPEKNWFIRLLRRDQDASKTINSN